MTINDMIKKLPPEYQEIARRYVPLLVDMKFEDLKSWIEMIAAGNWQKSYKELVSKMTVDELLAEERKGHEILKQLNKDNADRIALQFAIIEQIFLTSLLMLRTEDT